MCNQLPDRQEGFLLIGHVDETYILVPHPLRSLDSPALLKQGLEIVPSHRVTQFTDEQLHHLYCGMGIRFICKRYSILDRALQRNVFSIYPN